MPARQPGGGDGQLRARQGRGPSSGRGARLALGLVFRHTVGGAGWEAPRGTVAAQVGVRTYGATGSWAGPSLGSELFHRTISFHQATVLVNEKLGEVPFDSVSQDAPSLGLDFHPLPQRVGILSVHTDPAAHIKCDTVAGSELFDLCIHPQPLPPGLAERESQEHTPHSAYRACGSIGGVQFVSVWRHRKAMLVTMHMEPRPLSRLTMCLLMSLAENLCMDGAQRQPSRDTHTLLASLALPEPSTEGPASAGGTGGLSVSQ